jgi:hypothetical protein
VEGMILEYVVLNAENGEQMQMLVTDLDLKKTNSISTEGYQIISMKLEE